MTVRHERVRHNVPREAYLVIRAGLARKTGLVKVRGSKFEVFGTSNPELRTSNFGLPCRARLACLAHNSPTTSDEERRSGESTIAAEVFMNNAG